MSPAVFGSARAIALYLLSAWTAGVALVAWPIGQRAIAAVLLAAIAPAVAIAAGEAAASLGTETQRVWRARGRLLSGIGYAGALSLAAMVTSAVPEPALIAREVGIFVTLQSILLAVGLAVGETHLALMNAVVLVVFAALRGGGAATAAAAGSFLLLTAFLAADNASRILSAYAASRAPSVGRVAAEWARLVLPVAVVLTAGLIALPAAPWPGVRWTSAPPGDLPPGVYVLLTMASLAGAGTVALVSRLVRASRRPPPLEEVTEALSLEEEALPPEVSPVARLDPGPRGRVMHAYLSFLSRVARQGRPRRPDWTPWEFARWLGSPVSVRRLTELFVDARYGPDEPSEEAVSAAESAAAAASREISPPVRRSRRQGFDEP